MTIQVQSNNAEADALVNKPAEASKPDAKVEKAASAPAEETQAEHNLAANSEAAATEEEESEAKPEGEDLQAQEGEESEPKDEASSEEPPKKKGGFQRRIDKLNARAAAAEQRAALLESLLAKQNAGGLKADDPKVEPAKPAAGDGKPKPDAFETHAEYVEALTDWKTDQKFKERDQKASEERLKTEQAKQVETYHQKAKAFLETHPDFDEVMADLVVSPVVVGIIQSSENGPEIAYELGKNPKEAQRISKLTPLQAALELGAIKSRIASKSSAEKKPEPKRVSSAPAPLAPVGGGGKATAPPKTLEEAAKHSYAEYKRVREEQLKQSRRRA